jgi:hypothetical protein
MVSMPKRIQMKRTKGWRKPEGVIYVGRPNRWGNPYRVEELGREEAMRRFRQLFSARHGGKHPDYPVEDVEELRGRDLACWCHLDELCHADILMEFANR